MKVHHFLSLIILFLFMLGLVVGPTMYYESRHVQPVSGPTIQIDSYFSPKGGCTQAAVQEITNAKKSVYIQAYSFTSPEIIRAVIDDFNRGIDVRVILDKSNLAERYSGVSELAEAKVPVWIDKKHAIAHNKIIILDHQTLIQGSFNFTRQAERENAENMLVIRGDQALTDKYSANFELHLAHSVQY